MGGFGVLVLVVLVNPPPLVQDRALLFTLLLLQPLFSIPSILQFQMVDAGEVGELYGAQGE